MSSHQFPTQLCSIRQQAADVSVVICGQKSRVRARSSITWVSRSRDCMGSVFSAGESLYMEPFFSTRFCLACPRAAVYASRLRKAAPVRRICRKPSPALPGSYIYDRSADAGAQLKLFLLGLRELQQKSKSFAAGSCTAQSSRPSAGVWSCLARRSTVHCRVLPCLWRPDPRNRHDREHLLTYSTAANPAPSPQMVSC